MSFVSVGELILWSVYQPYCIETGVVMNETCYNKSLMYVAVCMFLLVVVIWSYVSAYILPILCLYLSGSACVVFVAFLSSVKSLSNVKIRPLNATTVHISWDTPESHGIEVLGFNIYFNLAGSEEVRKTINLVEDNTEHILGGLGKFLIWCLWLIIPFQGISRYEQTNVKVREI